MADIASQSPPQNPVLSALNQYAQNERVKSGMGNGSPFSEALSSMKLTPQEQYLYWHHMNNLYGSGKYIQPDGSVSTLKQAVVEGPGGKSYNIPTIWNGKELSVEEATAEAAKVGWNRWPSYSDPNAADLRYETLHPYLERDLEQYLGSHPSPFLLDLFR